MTSQWLSTLPRLTAGRTAPRLLGAAGAILGDGDAPSRPDILVDPDLFPTGVAS